MLRYQHFSDHILSVSTSLTAPNLVIKTHLIKTDVSDRQTYSFCSKLKKICLFYSPYLPVGRWGLSDDGAGLRRGQGLLDHYAGIVVAHPRVGMLVLALACLAVQ